MWFLAINYEILQKSPQVVWFWTGNSGVLAGVLVVQTERCWFWSLSLRNPGEMNYHPPSELWMLCHFSHVRLCATPWMVAHQAPLSMGFSRQEYWSGLPFPPPEDLPFPGIEPTSLKSPALAGRFFTTSATWEVKSTTWALRPMF